MTLHDRPRLYTVTVSFEFAVLADNEEEAGNRRYEVARDALYDADVSCIQTVRKAYGQDRVDVIYPDGWDDSALIYGTDTDTTLGEAVAREKAALHEDTLADKQGDLFGKKP